MRRPYIALFIATTGVSFAAIFIRSVSPEVAPLTIAFYRLLFTTIIILPFTLSHPSWRHDLVTLSRRQVLWMSVIGIILAAHFALWITSLTKTSVASSVMLVTAHPVMVAPLAYVFLREQLSKVNVTGIALSIAGAAILVFGNYSLKSSTLEGNILAILGGAAAGLYILGGRKLRERISVMAYATVVFGIAAVTLFVLCLATRAPLSGISMRDHEIIFLMAVVSGIFGHTLYNWALRYLRASVISVSLLGEPLGSALLAFALPWIGEVPTLYTIVGGCFIIPGIYLTMRGEPSYL